MSPKGGMTGAVGDGSGDLGKAPFPPSPGETIEVPDAEFYRNIYRWLRVVEQERKVLILTHFGRPVAKVIPVPPRPV